jgi:LemA protein
MKIGEVEVSGKWIGLVVLAILILWLIGSYNGLVNSYETVEQAIGQVNNVNQRRFDLIPNLVETVKGYAAHEKGTLEEVTKARASIGQIKLAPNMTPADLQRWQQAQGDFAAALSRLMMVSERYPDLKASQNFRDLQAELAGTENRIAVERRQWLLASRTYNVKVKRFPSNTVATIFGFHTVAYFEAEAGAKTAPKVKF